MQKTRGGYHLLTSYVGREYLLSLIVAFAFFFFIFFINQILLVAQKILVKNVSIPQVLKLVSLAIPQFLLYTFPFSSLTASAMVLGDFSASNEVLAMRSSGISMRHLYYPICVLSIGVSLITLYTANYLLPVSSQKYKTMYVEMMRDLPTIELSSYSTNTIGNNVMTNGKAEGSHVENLLLFDTAQGKDSQMVSSPSASILMEDPVNFIYRLDMDSPNLLTTSSATSDWTLSNAESATMYLDFSNLTNRVTDTVPSQLSIAELQQKSQEKKVDLDNEYLKRQDKLADLLNEASSMELDEDFDITSYNKHVFDYTQLLKTEPTNFYYQYYRAEMHKKLALSIACFMLVFLTFPLSYRRLKHGRLIGFGVAMFSAVAYWYLLFFAQLYIFKIHYSPAFLIWMPNVVLFLLGVIILRRSSS